MVAAIAQGYKVLQVTYLSLAVQWLSVRSPGASGVLLTEVLGEE